MAKNSPNNFTLKICLFGANYIVKNSAKSKYVYIGYGIAFDGLGSWSFGNDFARNVIIFGVDNSSSSQADDCKINFLVLGEGSTDDINSSICKAEKSLILILVKQRKTFV